jgi:hypothetical protein
MIIRPVRFEKVKRSCLPGKGRCFQARAVDDICTISETMKADAYLQLLSRGVIQGSAQPANGILDAHAGRC